MVEFGKYTNNLYELQVTLSLFSTAASSNSAAVMGKMLKDTFCFSGESLAVEEAEAKGTQKWLTAVPSDWTQLLSCG